MKTTAPDGIFNLPALLAAGLFVLGLSPAGAEDGPATWTDRQKEEFLRTAEVTHEEILEIGVTGSRRVTLELEGHVHDAHVQTVNVTKHKQKLGGRTEMNFRDSYKYNVAAYRLDRLLGMDMVPVSVLRHHKGDWAAVTWWIDNIQMSERERVKRNLNPPQPLDWHDQLDRAKIFDQLIYNTDWNMSNLLISDDWEIRLIDFTRAFRTFKRLRAPEKLRRIDVELLERLRALDKQVLRQELKNVLSGHEIRGVLARRDAIVSHFEERIRTRGESAVLYGDKLPK